MRKLQNTLYVTTPMAYLSLDGETIVIQDTDASALAIAAQARSSWVHAPSAALACAF